MSSYPNTCSICLDDISLTETEKDNGVTMLECNHPFHTRCISQLRVNKCPSCRRRFTNISPKILSPILQRENADIFSRNTENLNFVLNNFINTPFDLPERQHRLNMPDDMFILLEHLFSPPPNSDPPEARFVNTITIASNFYASKYAVPRNNFKCNVRGLYRPPDLRARLTKSVVQNTARRADSRRLIGGMEGMPDMQYCEQCYGLFLV